jgi:Antibiotic biosynthesis monooxygenase
MITVQRRWFIPPHLYDEFRLRWLEEMGPVLPSLPGFIRAEIYDSAIPEQWTTLVTWDTEEHRVSATLTEEAIGFYSRYSHFEKGLAETLYLIGKIDGQSMSQRTLSRTEDVVPREGA